MRVGNPNMKRNETFPGENPKHVTMKTNLYFRELYIFYGEPIKFLNFPHSGKQAYGVVLAGVWISGSISKQERADAASV